MRPDENKKRHIVVCGKSGGGSGEQVQADWNQTDSEQPDYIKNKPTIPAAQVNSDWNASSGVAQILNKPNLATVATSGSYNDLSNKPTIPAAQVQADWNQSDNTQVDYIKNKPTILTQWFGTKQEYDAILVKDPNVIYNIEGTDNVQADWNQSDSSADDYIKNKPTIPAAQVNSDWNAVSGVAQILNKPIIPAAQVNSDWNSASGVSQILNKPTIPSETETLTFTLQGGTVVSLEVYVKSDDSPYFYVEDISGDDNTLTIRKIGDNAPTIEVFKSTDQTNWVSIGSTDTTGITATIPANGKLYLKATADTWSNDLGCNSINTSEAYNVGGNIMSLLYGDNFGNQRIFPTGSTYNFDNIFGDSSDLVSAQGLILPATTLTEGCYEYMFNSCTGLTTAPVLPATTLAEVCYQNMFQDCRALTTAPVLPATTLVQGCYGGMFNGCTDLNSVTTYAQDISATDCLNMWLSGVAATGEFFNLGGASYPSGASGIPSGWTEHNSL